MATILVIEDNPANMKLAVFMLESAGYSVRSATDAEAGLTLARKERPDLILMDIQLPGMDGLSATVQLKQDPQTRAIPVIALTALHPYLNRKALAAFDGGADVFAADGDFHGIQHILGAEAVTGHGGAIDFNVEIGFSLDT